MLAHPVHRSLLPAHRAEPPAVADAAEVVRLHKPYRPSRSHQHYPQVDRWDEAHRPRYTCLCSRAIPVSADH